MPCADLIICTDSEDTPDLEDNPSDCQLRIPWSSRAPKLRWGCWWVL